jgi:hypothetical protein
MSQVCGKPDEARAIAEDWRQHALSNGFTEMKAGRLMLAKRTTFVVGAGASRSYGLPTAGELFSQASVLEPRSKIYQLVVACGVEASDLSDVVLDLNSHGGPSIDEFIEHRAPYRPRSAEIGKLILAALLGSALADLDAANPERYGDDWIAPLIDVVSSGVSAEEFTRIAATNLHFVTFNFDTLIQERAKNRIAQRYAGDPALGTALDSIRVLHVHGSIAKPPTEPIQVPGGIGANRAPIGVSSRWIEWTTQAAEGIHLTHEEIAPVVLHDAEARVVHTTVLCFLGFSYERNNLRKLGIPASLKHNSHQHCFGSAYGLSNGRRTRIEQIFQPTQIKLGDERSQCRQLLDDFHILRDFD